MCLILAGGCQTTLAGAAAICSLPDAHAGGCDARNPVVHVLGRPPRVFTLQLAWESHREEPGDIAATLAAVDERVGGGIISAQHMGS